MAKTTVSLEWQVVRDDPAWEETEQAAPLAAETLPAHPVAQARIYWHKRTVQMVVAIALLLFALAGFMLWREAEAGVQQIRAEVEDAVAAEQWDPNRALHTRVAPSLWVSGVDPIMPLSATTLADQQSTVKGFYLRDQMVMARVQISLPHGGMNQPLWATRFYRQIDGRWQRTGPQSEFWGPARTLETTYFRFHYRQRDAGAVLAIAHEIDDHYTQLRRDVALSPVPAAAEQKLVIMVETSMPVLFHPLYVRANGHLHVPSPWLLVMPQDVTDADLLASAILQPVIAQVMDEATRRYGTYRQLPILARGIQLWQAYASGASGAAQDRPLGWFYREAPALGRGVRAPAPADWWTLCQSRAIWDSALPLELMPWSFCVDPDWSDHLRQIGAPPTTLIALQEERWTSGPTEGGVLDAWMQIVAAAALIDYVVESYGREQLPALLRGMRRYETYNDLIRNVFGVSAEAFEIGWQGYLAEEYGFVTDML